MSAEGTLTSITSLTLLAGLRDQGNAAAWQRFADRYRPMVVSFAAKLGLSESDAQDAAQETLLAFAEGYRRGAYDRERGRLRSWLFGIAHRKIIDIQRRMGREQVLADRSDATGFLASVQAPDEAERLWEQQWQQAVLNECLAEVADQVDPTTFEAFRLYALAQWPPQQVARHLGLSRNAVYISKNRVISRMRELRQRMEDIW